MLAASGLRRVGIKQHSTAKQDKPKYRSRHVRRHDYRECQRRATHYGGFANGAVRVPGCSGGLVMALAACKELRAPLMTNGPKNPEEVAPWSESQPSRLLVTSNPSLQRELRGSCSRGWLPRQGLSLRTNPNTVGTDPKWHWAISNRCAVCGLLTAMSLVVHIQKTRLERLVRFLGHKPSHEAVSRGRSRLCARSDRIVWRDGRPRLPDRSRRPLGSTHALRAWDGRMPWLVKARVGCLRGGA